MSKQLSGVVILKDLATIQKYGYDFNLPNMYGKPVLVFRDTEIDSTRDYPLFYENQDPNDPDQFRYLSEVIIDVFISIEEAKIKFPSLFI